MKSLNEFLNENKNNLKNNITNIIDEFTKKYGKKLAAHPNIKRIENDLLGILAEEIDKFLNYI